MVSQNRKILVDIRFGSELVVNDDRKLLALDLHQKVTSIFKPVTNNMDEEFVPLHF
jgi:hypothetical protein